MEETAVGALARVCASEDGHILAAPEGTAFKSIASVDTSADTTQGDESSTPNSFQQPDTLTASIREAFEGKRCASLDDFHLLATIGRANFAKMFLAKAKVSQSLYVLRATRKDLIIESKEVGHIKEERDALLIAAKERHPFIVQVESTFQTETRLYTVLEYLGGGDLMYHIQKGQFSADRAQFYATQILLAYQFLHEHSIMHRNFKLDDVLLGMDGYIKVTGLEFCKSGIDYNTKTSTFCGTTGFMAPEILLDKEYGLEVDWWAFGIAMYQMLLGQSPFHGENEDEIYDAILSDEPLYPVHMPGESVTILQRLLDEEPKRRLGCGPEGSQDVMNHPYFQNVSWEDIYHKRVEPPFLPTMDSSTDLSNFDQELTSVTPRLTPVESVLSTAMQDEFRDFSHMGVY